MTTKRREKPWKSFRDKRIAKKSISQDGGMGVLLVRSYKAGVRNFPGICLRGASLREANLREIILCDADLSGADLRRVRFQQADLRRANLRQANLREANLEGANLEGADLQDANFKGAKVSREQLEEARCLIRVILPDGSMVTD